MEGFLSPGHEEGFFVPLSESCQQKVSIFFKIAKSLSVEIIFTL